MSSRAPQLPHLDDLSAERHEVALLGGTTRYWAYGPSDAATTVVAVHGFRGDHHGLEPVVAELPGFRVLAPDLPGFGESTPMEQARHDIEGYGVWLRAFIAHAAPADAVVLGHSFGSIIVAASAAESLGAPRLVLVNPIGAPALAGPRGMLTRLAVLYYRLGSRLPERVGSGLLRNRLIVRIMSVAMAKTRDRTLRRWIHDQHDRYFSQFANRRVLLEAFRASVGSHVGDYASSIEVPTLLVAAERDDVTPIRAQHELQRRFADARLVVLEEVGHLIHYEKPREAAAAIREFLGK